jgi:ABC-2 type transport system permease protein
MFVRIIVAGFAVAAAFTSISLAAGSLTTRRAFASVGVVVVVLVSTTLANVLVENAETSENVLLVSLFDMPFELVQRIYGEPGELPEISTALVVAANLAWTVLGLVITGVRYRQLTVTR